MNHSKSTHYEGNFTFSLAPVENLPSSEMKGKTLQKSLNSDSAIIEQIVRSKQHIKFHVTTRIDTFFYLLIAYYGTGLKIMIASTVLQHGACAMTENPKPETFLTACHSALFPNLWDDAEGVLVPEWKRKNILENHAFFDSLNATVALPGVVNYFDYKLAGQSTETSLTGKTPYAHEAIAIINQVSSGLMAPIEGMNQFIKILMNFLDDLEESNYLLQNLKTAPAKAKQLIHRYTKEAVLFVRGFDYIRRDYIEMLLGVNPIEQKELLRNPKSRAVIYAKKYTLIAREILTNPPHSTWKQYQKLYGSQIVLASIRSGAFNTFSKIYRKGFIEKQINEDVLETDRHLLPDRWHHLNGDKLMYFGNFSQAVFEYTKAIEYSPNQPIYYANRALAKYHLNPLDISAAQDYFFAISLDKNILIRYPTILRQTFNAIIGMHYNHAGNLKANSGNHIGAVEDYTQAIAYNPKESIHYANRAISEYKVNPLDINAAQDYFFACSLDENILSKCPLILHQTFNAITGMYYNYIGNLKADSGNYSGAVEDYTHAITYNPRESIHYASRAFSRYHVNSSDISAAQDYFFALRLNENILRRYPTVLHQTFDTIIGMYYNHAGNLKANSGKHSSAVEDYTHAIAYHPREPIYYVNRAVSKYNVQPLDISAAQDYFFALSLDKNILHRCPIPLHQTFKIIIGIYYNHQGNLKLTTGEYQEAVAQYTYAIRFNNQNAFYYANRSLARYNANHQDRHAIEDYLEAIRLDAQVIDQYYPSWQQIFKAIAYSIDTIQTKSMEEKKSHAASPAPNISSAVKNCFWYENQPSLMKGKPFSTPTFEMKSIKTGVTGRGIFLPVGGSALFRLLSREEQAQENLVMASEKKDVERVKLLLQQSAQKGFY